MDAANDRLEQPRIAAECTMLDRVGTMQTMSPAGSACISDVDKENCVPTLADRIKQSRRNATKTYTSPSSRRRTNTTKVRSESHAPAMIDRYERSYSVADLETDADGPPPAKRPRCCSDADIPRYLSTGLLEQPSLAGQVLYWSLELNRPPAILPNPLLPAVEPVSLQQPLNPLHVGDVDRLVFTSPKYPLSKISKEPLQTSRNIAPTSGTGTSLSGAEHSTTFNATAEVQVIDQCPSAVGVHTLYLNGPVRGDAAGAVGWVDVNETNTASPCLSLPVGTTTPEELTTSLASRPSEENAHPSGVVAFETAAGLHPTDKELTYPTPASETDLCDSDSEETVAHDTPETPRDVLRRSETGEPTSIVSLPETVSEHGPVGLDLGETAPAVEDIRSLPFEPDSDQELQQPDPAQQLQTTETSNLSSNSLTMLPWLSKMGLVATMPETEVELPEQENADVAASAMDLDLPVSTAVPQPAMPPTEVDAQTSKMDLDLPPYVHPPTPIEDQRFIEQVKTTLYEVVGKKRKLTNVWHRSARRIHKLLELAQPPDAAEARFLSAEDATKYFTPTSFFPGIVIVDNQQPLPLQTIQEFLQEYYDDSAKVHIQDSNLPLNRKGPYVRIKSVGQLKERFSESEQKTTYPWNCLELATHVEDGLRPAFLNTEDCRLLTKLKLPSSTDLASRRGYAPGWKEVEKWALLAQRGALTEPHQDSHGYSTYITVNQGIMGFGWLANPTAAERAAWRARPDMYTGGRWRYAVLRPGQTVFFPGGTVHFVFRLRSDDDTLAFGGHVLRCSQIVNWVKTMLEEKAMPSITNEDITISAAAYLERVEKFVQQARRMGQSEKWGGDAAITEFLRLKKEFMGSA